MAILKGKVLILVENLSVPFDRRPWREAVSLKEAGCQVSVICPKGRDRDTASREEIDDIAIYRFSLLEAQGGLLAYALEYAYALLMMFYLSCVVWLQRGFDVIQICNPPDLLFLLTLPFKLLGKKMVFDHHDLSPEVWIAKGGQEEVGEHPGMVYKVLLALERLTFYFADAVMSTNASYKKLAVERGRKREEEVFVVRNGLSLDQIKTVAPNTTFKEGKTYLISYVGMMGAQDGVDYLLRAVAHLRHELGRTDFHVRLMGDGPELNALQRLSNDLEIADLLTFTGRITHDACLEGIASADVCVCPDPKIGLNDKSTLVKVMEYMSLGKPTVAFDLTETRYSAGESALYATPNEIDAFAGHLDALLSDADARERLGAIARERVVEGLAWDHSKEHMFDAYRLAFNKAGIVQE